MSPVEQSDVTQDQWMHKKPKKIAHLPKQITKKAIVIIFEEEAQTN